MAEELLEKARDILDGQIVGYCSVLLSSPPALTESQDFEGQRLADYLTAALLSISGVSQPHARTCHLRVNFF